MSALRKTESQLIEIPDKLIRLIAPKRFKVIIGGRGGGKSESVASLFASMVYQSGCTAVCCREFQTSIKQSVHSLMRRKIKDLDLDGFNCLQSEITHANGGYIGYQGLARDPQAIKSIDNAELCWVEEAQSLSEDSIEELTPSIRVNDAEIWFTANLQSSNDPFSKRFFTPFESELREHGFYEDDLHTIVWINYDDNPWFPAVLEQERARDHKEMDRAAYDHKWLGEPSDQVEGSIIRPEWFDACIDAHVKLGFKPQGVRISSHDPSDTGADSKGYAYRHGSVFLDIQEKTTGDVNEGGHWATGLAIMADTDYYTWDCDGMGVALNEQTAKDFVGKPTKVAMFKGSEGPDNPAAIYQPAIDSRVTGQKTVGDVFRNKRAQYYFGLSDRMYKTYRAVIYREYQDPDEMISFSSSINCLPKLRSELCRVPLKPNNNGFLTLYTKAEMKSKFGIDSPNLGDSVMMSMRYINQHITPARMPRKLRAMGMR